MQLFKLVKKVNLTNNVYEMVFEWENEINMKNWQFMTFIIEGIWWRAYSILKIEWKNIVLIIKKREQEEWGRWWSILICDLNIWESLKWVWPAGHFILKENNNNKLFIWTGTWFVPLYNQILWAIQSGFNCNLKLIFWIREKKDIFYINELNKIKQNNINFDYEIYLSREYLEWTNKWYVTDFLNIENISIFQEFYICWMPLMIDSSVEILKKLWINENTIYFEKY